MQGVLHGYVTPRNIVFAPDGKALYVSDSSLGTIAKIDTVSLQAKALMAAGPGAFGTALSKDGSALYVVNYLSNTISKVRASDMSVVQAIAVA